ncbi:MAG TPA: hypothetical protein VNQ56_12800 [Pseudolabrys sp.]|nr:hypothetical protein [Pseudolabrys sp.]
MLGFGPLAGQAIAEIDYSPGTYLSLPALALTMTPRSAAARAGRNVGLPSAPITIAPAFLGMRAGRNVGLPHVVLSLERPRIGILAGRYLGLPATAITFSYGAVIARTGRIFNLANTVEIVSTTASLAETALGTFALCEGPEVTAEHTIAFRLKLKTSIAQTLAGRNLPLTATVLTVIDPVPEIYARHRKVKVQAILH